MDEPEQHLRKLENGLWIRFFSYGPGRGFAVQKIWNLGEHDRRKKLSSRESREILGRFTERAEAVTFFNQVLLDEDASRS
jgi:hypothetical protein